MPREELTSRPQSFVMPYLHTSCRLPPWAPTPGTSRKCKKILFAVKKIFLWGFLGVISPFCHVYIFFTVIYIFFTMIFTEGKSPLLATDFTINHQNKAFCITSARPSHRAPVAGYYLPPAVWLSLRPIWLTSFYHSSGQGIRRIFPSPL